MEQTPAQQAFISQSLNPKLKYWRIVLPIIIFALSLHSDIRALILGVLADAFFQVSVFVAATLAFYYGLSARFSGFKLTRLISKNNALAYFVVSFLGALPGCGGAIIVVTQFVKGKVSFAAVVAVLTSTMGDAAFLLLAQQPLDGFLIMSIGIVVGTLSGFIVGKVHKDNFLRPDIEEGGEVLQHTCHRANYTSVISASFWKIVFIPALLIACMMALQIDVSKQFNIPPHILDLSGALMCVFVVVLWSLNSKGDTYQNITSEEDSELKTQWINRVVLDTQFVTSWVVTAFLLFELSVFFFDINLEQIISNYGAWAVLGCILIGLLPGCGPQILVTGLYLQQAIPFSAQIGNAISNDGDALFPALALAPKAALLATVYSAIPALIVGFGYLLVFE